MRPAFSMLLALLLLCTPSMASAQRKKTEDPFSRPERKKENRPAENPFAGKTKRIKPKKGSLPDFYARAVQLATDHNQLPSFFSTRLKREKERTQHPDYFSRSAEKKERYALADHFSHPSSNKKRGAAPDHFSSASVEKKHTEDELYSKGASRHIYRKNFIGERFRLFNIDPNRKKKKQQRKQHKKRDPFGRDRRKMDQPQLPRGESGLFPGGVLPRMDDPR